MVRQFSLELVNTILLNGIHTDGKRGRIEKVIVNGKKMSIANIR